jgi:uncharacterized protein with PIN domain
MKFIADIMVGKLAKYLRMAGYDVIYMNDASDDEIIKIARKTNRVVLTRDSLMLERKDFKNGNIKYLHIKDVKLKNQLEQVKSELGLSLEPNLIRCIECNRKLVKVKKEDIKNKVPPYVYKTQENFLYCKKCDKYYWRGTHYNNIKNTFLSIKDRGSPL